MSTHSGENASVLLATNIANVLISVMNERRLVRLRTRFDAWTARGYIVGVSTPFVMVAVVNDRIHFDGFECFRRHDIVEIVDDPYSAFVETALARRGEAFPQLPTISLDGIEALLETAGRLFRLITIYSEEVDPDACYIGQFVQITEGRFIMHAVTPGAEWEPEPERHTIASITRVSFGADYEAALALVVPTAPKL